MMNGYLINNIKPNYIILLSFLSPDNFKNYIMAQIYNRYISDLVIKKFEIIKH